MYMKKEKNIFMTTQSVSLETSIKVLKETIAWFKKQIEPHDCGWMHTTIDGLKHRIEDLSVPLTEAQQNLVNHIEAGSQKILKKGKKKNEK